MNELSRRVRRAEELAEAGNYREAARRVAELSGELVADRQPALLARAAWVAGIAALIDGDCDEFRLLAKIAADALTISSQSAARELALLSWRLEVLARFERASDPDDALRGLFQKHLELLRTIDGPGDQLGWARVDSDRADWPHFLAAAEARLGRSTDIARRLNAADTDGIGRVIVAMVLAADGSGGLAPDEVAALCFREPASVALARERVNELVRSGQLELRDGRVRTRG